MIDCLEAMKLLYADSVIPVVIFSNEMEVVWHNRSLTEVFKTESLISRNLSALTQFPLKENLMHSKGFSGNFQVHIYPENSRSAIVSMLIFPIQRSDSFPEYFTAYLDDLTEDRNMMLRKTYLGLLEASKLKDDDTGNHIKRVGAYARKLSEECFIRGTHSEINHDFIDNIHFLAPMHDVGKIGTPDEILTKRGPLNESEWDIMKQHTINGALIMSNYPDGMASAIARSHHEKWDGSGYLYGLVGNDIPLAARITAIADVYDALRMKRSYKEAFSHEKSVKIIQENSGSHFDPDLIAIFLSIDKSFCDIYDALSDEPSDSAIDTIEDLPVYDEDYSELSELSEEGDAEPVEELEELYELEAPEELEEL